ncbi:methyltransferase domain-containing protein [Novosphingobium sp. 9U]|uniref:methyltransferase domain-containing protein n=1 Tax=Novosphingobium sp. 9U TaxID=2653158 RepID=UPI0012F12BBA|nr:methyltransferase domain-containing protein [Novosphingobium sp. 9U]VWX52815.1 Biotin biosynthesis protein [Novosphingobium sp. 9U]
MRRRDPLFRGHAGVSQGQGDVSRAFGAAAEYDRHARVQRLAARELARRIAALPLPRDLKVLEIGCGTGFLTQALRDEGLSGDWLLTDIAPAMLERARARMGDAVRYAVLDGENGTPPARDFDLICASLATQWFAQEADALARWREWLAPVGHVMVATLGPGTFAEWREAHAAEDLAPGTPQFTQATEWAAIGLAEPLATDLYRERHADAAAFLHALRGIGATTAAPGHRPLGAGALRRVMRRFEAGGAIATYEVMTCHLTRAR